MRGVRRVRTIAHRRGDLPSRRTAELRVLACCERIPFGSCGGSDHVAWQIHRRLARRGVATTMVAAVAPGEAPLDEVRDGVRLDP